MRLLCVLLACLPWAPGSHCAPLKADTASPQDNHTAICAEIQRELSADKNTYKGSFNRPQNTSEELCYGEFTKNFTSTLKDLVTKYDKQDHHIKKIYKDMEELTRICPKLKPTDSPTNCTIEQSDFSKFKEALESVITSIEGWKSCKGIKRSLRDPLLPWT
uniref:Granulocyte-macrophage colony-stimulating factor n=1 Tax=Prolemur simus TaxID=1328070 RepID=A0A8C9ARE1_PROSS